MTDRQSARVPVLFAAALAAASLVAVPAAHASTTTPAPPAGAVFAPDGLRAAWVVDGNNVWSETRANPHAPWQDPHRDLTIRGAVDELVFSPNSRELAFENLRGSPGSPQNPDGTDPGQNQNHGFIVVFYYPTRSIRYVDPVFATDTDPVWSADGSHISFVRHVSGLPDQQLTEPTPSLAPWQRPPERPGDSYSFASLLAAPIAYQPQASGDGRSVAYVSTERTRRAINFERIGEPAQRIADYPNDDGIELSQLAVSRAGSAVAYVRGSAPNSQGEILNPQSLPDPPHRQVWLVTVDPRGGQAGAPRLLGDGYQPQFSPDDQRLVWVSGQNLMSASLAWEPGGQLAEVGTPTTLFSFTGSLSTLRFSPDSSQLAYQHGSAVEVYSFATGTTWVVPHTGASDAAPSWSPDGQSIAYRRNVSGQPWSIWVAKPAGQQTRQVWQANPGVGSSFYGLDQNPTEEAQPGDQLLWSANGLIAFPWEGDGWRHLYDVPAAGGAAQLLTPGNGEVETAAVTRDGSRIIYATNIGDIGRRHLSSVAFSGGTPSAVTSGLASQWAPTPLAGDQLAYVNASWNDPPAVMLRAADGTTSRATLPVLPASFPASKLVQPQLVQFPSSDGQTTVYGQLFEPAHPNGCSMIYVHGGPARQMLPGFHYFDVYSYQYEMNQYVASHGCTVLSVDYRSGTMYGYAYRNPAAYAGEDPSAYEDVLGGVNFLRSRPDVDPNNMGIYGLSWGGYLTSIALARNSDIFKVALDMAPARAGQAIAQIDGWHSPVMLVQGDDDRDVNFQNGVDLAQALQTAHPEVELAQRVFPNELHETDMTYPDLVDTYDNGAQFLLNHLPPG